MSVLISKATGNWTDATATWGVASAATDAYANAEQATHTVTTAYSGTQSAAFTPGAVEIDAILVKLSVRTGTTGTMSVHLELDSDDSEVAGTEVTVDTADLPPAVTADLNGGWLCFQLAAPVTLAAATAYQVAAKTSSASQIGLMRFNATSENIARAIRTTTEAAPAAGDDVIICGQYIDASTFTPVVITYDETAATDYGSATTSLVTPSIAVCNGGTFKLATAASTNYNLRLSGLFMCYSQGIITFGTLADPLPSTSTFTYLMDSASNVDFGLYIRALGNFTTYGASKAVLWTYLNTDEAAAQTVIGLTSTSGWSNGDVLAFASTTRTRTECESKIISTVDSSTQVTLTAGLTNAHSGTAPTQAEVANLTRNIVIKGNSTTLQGYVVFQTTSVISSYYTEYTFLGSATALKRGIDVATTTGSVDFQYNSVHDFVVTGSMGFNMTASTAANVTYSNNVSYNVNNAHITWVATSSSTNVFDGNLGILNVAATAIFNFQDVGGVITDSTAAGSASRGVLIQEAGGLLSGTIANLTSHSNASSGFGMFTFREGTITNLTAWRNASQGVEVSDTWGVIYQTGTLFGNATYNFNISGGGPSQNYIRDYNMNGDSSFSTTNGIGFITESADNFFEDCNLGTASGILTAHTNDTICQSNTLCKNVLRNCITASTNETSATTSIPIGSYVAFQRGDQTDNQHNSYTRYGTIAVDTTISSGASPSTRGTPNNATNKLIIPIASVNVNDGQTATVTLKVRESVVGDGTDYNGNFIRLRVYRNTPLSISADTTLDTATSSSAGAFEELSGTTAAVGDNGTLQFYVDCDGTTGWINVDDITVSVT